MAATTLSAILTRFETVVQAAPLSLTLSKQPFGDTLEPNTIISTLVRIVAGGMVSQRSQSNYSEARIERITVTLYQAMNFDGYGAQRDLADLCDDVVQALIADGPDQGYDVTEEKGSRKITRMKDADICQAQVNLLVDYDWNEA